MSDSIAVLGTGRMGAGLAAEFARVGRRVFLGSRDPDWAEQVAHVITGGAADTTIVPAIVSEIVPGCNEEAARAGDTILLCVPFSAAAGLIRSLGDALEGKIVVDLTNPFGELPANTSAAEEHAKHLPEGTRLVAAWKTTSYRLLEPRVREGVLHDVFVCADDGDAKATVSKMIEEIGFRPVDCGPLKNARVLDAMVPLMVEVDKLRGGEHLMAWKLLP